MIATIALVLSLIAPTVSYLQYRVIQRQYALARQVSDENAVASDSAQARRVSFRLDTRKKGQLEFSSITLILRQ